MSFAELLTADDVARITGLSLYTIRQAIRELELPATKLRGRYRVHPDDLAGWIERCRVQPALSIVIDGAPVPAAPQHRDTPAGGYRQAARQRRRAA